MKIFIDFDDTIFNTQDFNKAFKKVFLDNRVSDDLFKKTFLRYPVSKANNKFKKYSLKKHLENINNIDEEIDIDKLASSVEGLIKNLKNYVFDDFYSFIKRFNKNDLILISFGVTDFQKKKVKASKIVDFFSKIEITDCKSEIIKNFMENTKGENIYVIDDRPDQLQSIKKVCPSCTCIRIKRPEGRYGKMRDKKSFIKLDNLLQVRDFILKQQKG